MPYQGPWFECNHCNNSMLAAHKHDASALFWYTQRYHDPKTMEQDPPAGVTVPNRYSCAAGPWGLGHVFGKRFVESRYE